MRRASLKRQPDLDFRIPTRIVIEPIVDLPRHYRVCCECEDLDGLADYEFLNPIIAWLPPGAPEKSENVITIEYYVVTLKAAVRAAAQRWPGIPIEVERNHRRAGRPSIAISEVVS